MKGSAPAASRNPATFQEKKQAVIDDFEKKELVKLLATHRGKLRAAASEAGMDPKNFSDKLRKYGITLDAYK
jgi:transcriptional regulator of acetoin/glycerol metabolism